MPTMLMHIKMINFFRCVSIRLCESICFSKLAIDLDFQIEK